MVPSNEIDVAGKDGERLLKLLDQLDESDDVQKVYSNGNIDEAILTEAM
jgi:transcriptional/translational regulatory protein YebC/TACO1